MNRRGFLKAAAGIASLPLVGKMASSVKSPMVREGIANVANVVSDVVFVFGLQPKINICEAKSSIPNTFLLKLFIV